MPDFPNKGGLTSQAASTAAKAKELAKASALSVLGISGISSALNLHGEGALTNPLNYVTQNRFYVELASEIKASFSACEGLSITIEHTPFHEGGSNDQQRLFIGKPTFGNVTLKRGITDDLSFVNWIKQVLEGKPKQRLNINILLFNQAGATMQTWRLIGAIPVGWKSSGFEAKNNEVAIEELTLAYEGLKLLKSELTDVKAITGVTRGAEQKFNET